MDPMTSHSSVNNFEPKFLAYKKAKPRDWDQWEKDVESNPEYAHYTRDNSKIWNSSEYDSAGDLREEMTTLSSLRAVAMEIDGVRIDGDRHAFLCAFLSTIRKFDIPFEKKVDLMDYLLHRLEKVCYEFTRRTLSRYFELMFLVEHDETDLEDWALLMVAFEDRFPEGSTAGGELPTFGEARYLRNAACHQWDYSFVPVRFAVRWMAWMKDNECLDEVQQVLKVLHHDQCDLTGLKEQA